MPTLYYPCCFRLSGRDDYLIWYSNDQDGVLLNSSGRVAVFNNMEQLRNYAASADLSLEAGKPAQYNLDLIDQWLAGPAKETVQPTLFLEGWNLFDDVSRSVGGRKLFGADVAFNDVYEKLFWGNNLPAVTPAGQQYEPVWLDEEVEKLRVALNAGLCLFRNSIATVDQSGG